MQIAFFIGTHGTVQDALQRALLRNAEELRKRGTAVPRPEDYRDLLVDTLEKLGSAPPVPGAGDILLDAILEDDPEELTRIVMLNENMTARPRDMFSGRLPYQDAPFRMANLCRMFETAAVELFVCLRNPAYHLPALLENVPQPSISAFMGGKDPLYLKWSDYIARLTQAVPAAKITVWRDEDTPLLWGELIRALGGLPSGLRINGAFDALAKVMDAEGMKRFRAYLAQHTTLTEPQKRRVMQAFLDKYGMDEIRNPLPDLPGWDTTVIQTLTDRYDADMQALARMPGVTMLKA